MKNVEINGKKMFYQEKGEGYPVILGHSYLWDSNMWAPQLEALSKQYRCIAPDLWGHGQSDNLSVDKYSIDEMANDFYQFVQALGIEKCAVIGLSVGGMWGTKLALDHPELVSHLAIMGSFVGPEPSERQAEYFALLNTIESSKALSAAVADQVAPLFFSHETAKTKPNMVNDLVKNLQAIPEKNIATITTIGRCIFSRKSMLDQLVNLKPKILIAVGEGDIPRPPSESHLMAAKTPNAQFEVIPLAGHISNIEQPEVVSKLLVDFLQ